MNTARLKTLLAVSAFAGLMIGGAGADAATYDGPCTLSTTTVTCTGSQAADGVNVGDSGVLQLDINTVDGDIEPAKGTSGVVFDTSNEATANIQLGTYSILTDGEGADGVYISTWGTGTNAGLTLVGDVQSLGGRGVFVSGSGAVTSNTAGDISSAGDALTAKSWGGAVEVDHSGDLTSWEGQGLHVEGNGSDIDVTGDIDSLGDSVRSHSWGVGNTNISIKGDVTSREGSGLVVDESNDTVDDNHGDTADVTVEGAVDVNGNGISVTAMDSVTIGLKGTLNADTGFGIYGNSSYGGVAITQNGGAITAHTDGIVAEAHGAASNITITSTYAVTADEGRGVVAGTADGSVFLTLDGVTSKQDAVDAEAYGIGDVGVDIDSNGDIVSYEGRGIYARAAGGLDGITVGDQTFGVRINQTGDVTASGDAIVARTVNSNAYVHVDGDVVSYDGAGLYATTSNGLVDVSADSVTSKYGAIYAEASGTVNVDVDQVVSNDGEGVYAKSANSTATVTLGDVTTKLDAIKVLGNSGVVDAGDIVSYDGAGVSAFALSGTVNVTADSVTSKLDAIHAQATGGVTMNTGNIVSYDGAGVSAKTSSGSVNLTLGGVTSQLDAVYAQAASVTVGSGDIASYGGAGVFAKTTSGSVNLTLDGVTSQLDGIYAFGISGVTINAGDIASYDGQGVFAQSTYGVTSVSTGGVTSKLDAITALSDIKSVTVDAGDVVSYDGKGIVARGGNGAAGVTAGDVTSQLDAIYAEATINGTATVEAGNVVSYAGKGVYVTAARDLVSVSVDDVASELDAIYAVSANGSVTVDAGNVVSYQGKGVYATTPNGFVDVTVDGATTKLDAITAQSSGGDTGYVTVTSTGSVTSYDGKAIYATAVNGAVDIDVDSNNVNVASGVTSKLDAITTQTNNGAVTVNVAGDVLSYGGKGIDASTLSGAVAVTVGDDDPARIGGATSKLDAITAVAKDGSTTVGVTGNVVSYDGKGVYATSDTSAVEVTIGGNVATKLDAITAQSNSGSSTDLVKVDVGGDVTSYDGKAIQASAANGGVNVHVDGAVTSKGDAVTASTTGDGLASTVTVNTAGITSYSGRGIVAEATNRAVTVDNTGGLTAELTGIYVRSTGSGIVSAVDVTQTGQLTSWKATGIDALSTGGTVTVITSGGIDADLDAIIATSEGGDNVGSVAVTNTSGKIVSHKGSGIVASSAREGVTVTNTADIDADQDGISATSTGDTETSGVTVGQTGNITVATGRGIHVESLADAGITIDGDITGGTYGIHATSQDGAVEASIAADNTVSGSSEAGVYLNALTTAILTNRGDLSSAGLAFEFDGDGAGTMNNYGTVTGNFAFNGGAGTFNNLEDATYHAGTSMEFMGGGTLNNAGFMSMTTDEPDSALENSYLTGDFAQTDTGTLRTDIRFSDNWSDRLVVSGAADFGGKVSVNVNGDIDGGGLVKDFKILTAAEGLTLGDVTVTNPTLHASVVEQDGTDAILRIDGIDLAPDGLDATYSSLGDYLEDVFDAGAPDDLKPLLAALLSIPDLGSYEDALAQLTPEEYAQDVLSTYANNLAFTNRLLSCRVAGGENRFKAEGDCDWGGARLSTLDQDADGHLTAYDATYATIEAGTQRRLDANWRLGAAIGLTNSTTSAANGSTGTATQGQVGLVVKYDADALLIASAFTAGYGEHHTERTVSIGNIDETLTGDDAIAYASARFHGAYTFDLGAAYIKPLFNLDLTATHFGGVTETGGATALTIDPATLYAATFNPAIEIGGEFNDGSGTLIRPFVQVGLEASLISDLDLQARFSSVDPSLGGFTIGRPESEPTVKVSVGADVLTEDKTTLRVYYDGSFGASSHRNGLGLKLSHNF